MAFQVPDGNLVCRWLGGGEWMAGLKGGWMAGVKVGG